MILGITGTDGAGKGEKVWGTFARPCQLICERAKQNSDKVYSDCKSPAPSKYKATDNISRS